MTCNINTPKYPVISWQTYWTNSSVNEIEVGCDGNFDSFLLAMLHGKVYGVLKTIPLMLLR
jgi:hypothetical protein